MQTAADFQRMCIELYGSGNSSGLHPLRSSLECNYAPVRMALPAGCYSTTVLALVAGVAGFSNLKTFLAEHLN